MTQHHTVTVTIPTGHDDPESPAAKAAHVADIVRAYGDICDRDEDHGTVVIDMIADLMHYAAGLDDEDPERLVARAVDHYRAEIV